jgi:hypothetical protein
MDEPPKLPDAARDFMQGCRKDTNDLGGQLSAGGARKRLTTAEFETLLIGLGQHS